MKTMKQTRKPEEKANADGDKKDIYLFVCTGNSCRSPMAEALYNNFFAKGAKAASCGLYAVEDKISANAEYALEAVGIKDFRHIPRNVNEELMKESRAVICMTASHAARLVSMYPDFACKIYTMPDDIPDPYGGSKEDYCRCRDVIMGAMEKMFGNRTDITDK